MASQQQFPAQHTTTTSAPEQSDANKIRFNKNYIKAIEGRLKIVHLVVSIIVFICTMVSDYNRSSQADWMSFVSMSAFWTSLVLLFFWLINLTRVLSLVPWLTVELGYTFIWTFFWFVAGCVAAAFAAQGAGDAFAAASFFSYVGMCVFGFNAYYFYKQWRESGNQINFSFRSGTRNATSTTATTTTTTTTEHKY